MHAPCYTPLTPHLHSPNPNPESPPRAKCTKNKVAPPYRIAEFDIMFGSGINAAGCVLDAAEKVGVVIRRGAYYYLGDERLGQGREKTLETLAERPELLRWVWFGGEERPGALDGGCRDHRAHGRGCDIFL